MLECGHVMCLPCYLRFLKYSEDHFCPICGEYSDGSTLAVSFLDTLKEFRPQQSHEIVLKLMHRAPGYPAVPLDSPVHEKPRPDLLLYCRVVAATNTYLRNEYRAEKDLLEQEQAESLVEYGEAECYPEALAILRKCLTTRLEPKKFDEPTQQTPTPTPTQQPEEISYFYQTAFEFPTTFTLAPLDISILKLIYGEFANFPSTLEVKIENIIYTSMAQDPVVAKRLKTLNHIPEHGQLGLLECEWDRLPPQVFKKHGRALTTRRRSTTHRNNLEEQQRARAQSNADALFRLSAADTLPYHVPKPEINPHTLPTLGASSQVNPKPKVWQKNRADAEESERILQAARKNGRRNRNWLVIEP